MYDWYRRQFSFICLPVFFSMPFAFPSSSSGSYNSGLLIRHYKYMCGRLWPLWAAPCSSVLHSPLIFSLRMSHFSFVFNFFSILYLVNFYFIPYYYSITTWWFLSREMDHKKDMAQLVDMQRYHEFPKFMSFLSKRISFSLLILVWGLVWAEYFSCCLNNCPANVMKTRKIQCPMINSMDISRGTVDKCIMNHFRE